MRRLATPASLALAILTLALASRAQEPDAIPRTPSPDGAVLYIVSPATGETVHNPVTVRFGLAGMGVAPAGVQNPDTGHHHLLIDVDPLPPLDRPLPATDAIRHFGGGQTQVTLSLPPGEHTLRLILGDATHVPHAPPLVSEPVHIRVAED